MTARRRAALLVILLGGALGCGSLAAQAPERVEQFVYSIAAFNGLDYAGTFARREADTIYLLAEVDNFLTARNGLVYFWPITGEWKLDLSALDVAFEGTLELSARGQPPRVLGMTPYTYYNVRGEYELNWKVATEAEAEAVVRHSRDLISAYYEAVADYRQERMEYEQGLQEMVGTIVAKREAGEDVTELVAEVEKMEPPSEPQPPTHYVVPPVPVQQAFIINLPVGEYRIRMLTADGAVMEGSERRIVTFARRRAEAVGLDVIPGDKWTRPVESTSPSSVLYVDGSTDLYLRPFYQREYNDLFYEKMRRNDARGNPGLMKWVRIQQVPGAVVETRRGGVGGAPAHRAGSAVLRRAAPGRGAGLPDRAVRSRGARGQATVAARVPPASLAGTPGAARARPGPRRPAAALQPTPSAHRGPFRPRAVGAVAGRRAAAGAGGGLGAAVAPGQQVAPRTSGHTSISDTSAVPPRAPRRSSRPAGPSRRVTRV